MAHAASSSPEFEIRITPSGAPSLRSLVHGETFHPGVGPVEEARELHVRPQRLAARRGLLGRPLVLWDVGLGAAANALAVLAEASAAAACGCVVELHSFEVSTTALEFALQHRAALGYLESAAPVVETLLARGHAEAPGVSWWLHRGDFRETMHAAEIPPPDGLLYDPYSPKANPELWCLEHFSALRRRLVAERAALLTSYSLSTAVRTTLLLAGFWVGHGVATGEKHETTLAANTPELIGQPLGARWLERARRSTKAAPLQVGVPGGPISEEDWARLQAHPQFA